MSAVYIPIIKRSLSTLLHYPMVILFGLPIALSSLLPQPFGYLGWPNILSRLGLQYIAEPLANLSFPTHISAQQYVEGLLIIMRTDPWAFIRFLVFVVVAIALLVLILYGIPRAAGLLMETERTVQTGERVVVGRLWMQTKAHHGALLVLLVLLPFIPALFVKLFHAFAPTGSPTTMFVFLGVAIAYCLMATTFYASAYRVIGGFHITESIREGWSLFHTRFLTTIEFAILLVFIEAIGIVAAFLAGSIGLVPILLLLVIFWVVKWGTLFSWLLIATFFLILLYSLATLMALISLEYLMWVNLFYTFEGTKDTSFVRRCLRVCKAWHKRRRAARAA